MCTDDDGRYFKVIQMLHDNGWLVPEDCYHPQYDLTGYIYNTRRDMVSPIDEIVLKPVAF
jgi:hypothetical protein